MSDNLVPIQEYIQTTTRSFQYMSVQVQNIVLYQSVDILVKLFDANQALCDVKVLYSKYQLHKIRNNIATH